MTIQQLFIIIGLLTIAGCIGLWLYGLFTEGDNEYMKFKDDASMERMIDDLKAKEEKEEKLIEEEI